MQNTLEYIDDRLDEYLLLQASVTALVQTAYRDGRKQLVLIETDKRLIRDYDDNYKSDITPLLEEGSMWNAVDELKTLFKTYSLN